MTPTVQGETLVSLQDEQERELTVGTPAWCAWLETASTFSFARSSRIMDVASLHSPLVRRAIETINEGRAPSSLPFGEA